MLRINLLPSYVAQRRLTKQLTAIFVLSFGCIVTLMAGYAATLQPRLQKVTDEANAAVAAKAKIDSLTQQATTVSGQLPAIQTKVTFVKDLQEYNLAYAKLYTNVARYTSPKILYKSLKASGTTLTMDAYAPSLPDLTRYMQIMYNEPDIKALSISAIPAYRSAYTPDSDPITLPQLPPGYVAKFPGSNLPVKSFDVVNGQVTSLSTGAETVGSAAAAKTTALYDPHLGFKFTATAVLKKAVAPPALPSGATAAPTNGEFGGPGGPGGGPPGGPGGPPGAP
ncbi:MAG: hypothetical protein P4L33_17125 [Capsulimonadaceae bacterium]|nr:hypothetical protein [Capsulimonadaceae bacterium]